MLSCHRSRKRGSRLAESLGVGPVIATALVATVGNASQFASARHFAAGSGLYREVALHHRGRMFDQAIHEYAAALSTDDYANGSRRLINVRKSLDTTQRQRSASEVSRNEATAISDG